MALFGKPALPLKEVAQLREQGYSDNQVIDELKTKGFSLPQINNALAQAAIASPEAIPPETPGSEPAPSEAPPGMEAPPSDTPPTDSPEAPPGAAPPGAAPPGAPSASFPEELQGRIEEITEGLIDEKWDLLIEEVKKIVEWKEKVEAENLHLKNDLTKLKEDFKELHQGVLGKLETYDERMTDVGTELKAVGKVFHDVVPEFVENVKELKSVTKGVKKKKK